MTEIQKVKRIEKEIALLNENSCFKKKNGI